LVWAALAALLIGAPGSVVLHLEEVLELPKSEALALRDSLAAELRARRPVATTRDAIGCDTPDRCVAQLRAQTGAEEVVLLRIIGGPRRIRLVAERIRPAPLSPLSAEASLSRAPAEWNAALKEISEGIFPVLTTAPLVEHLSSEPSAGSAIGARLAPWGLLLAGLALAGGGLAVTLDRASAERAIEARRETDAEFRSDLGRLSVDGALGPLLLSLSAAGLLTGVAWVVSR
jgi:hypothetical protein